MDYKLIEEFRSLLEDSWIEKREEFIRSSREKGHDAKLNDYEMNEEDEEKSSEESKDSDESKKDSEDEEYETGDESPSTINLADALDYEKLKRDLNQFRASHSLSDKEVNEELENYFNRLSSDEKKMLHIFIKGLTQVTLLDVSGKVANIPADMKFEVKKKGAATSEKLKSKRRAQKLSIGLDDEEEIKDLSNQPIIIGNSSKRQESIQEILKIVKENA